MDNDISYRGFQLKQLTYILFSVYILVYMSGIIQGKMRLYFCRKTGRSEKNKISDLDKEHKKKLHKSMIYKALDEYSKRDLNPHSHYWPKDFKSFVSTIPPFEHPQKRRAENETRTRDPNLGKVMLYQLSYFRIWRTGAKINSFYVTAKLFTGKKLNK